MLYDKFLSTLRRVSQGLPFPLSTFHQFLVNLPLPFPSPSSLLRKDVGRKEWRVSRQPLRHSPPRPSQSLPPRPSKIPYNPPAQRASPSAGLTLGAKRTASGPPARQTPFSESLCAQDMAPTQDDLSPSPPLEQTLKANPQLSRTDIQYLREWLSKQPHLPDMTEAEIVPFLHSNEYSLEQTKICIDKYFTMRTHAPEVFDDFDFDNEDAQHQLVLCYFIALPKKDPDGCRIICGKVMNNETTNFNYELLSKVCYAYIDIIISEDPTCNGYKFVFDCNNVTLGHVSKLSISTLNKNLVFFQEALPVRLKAFHVANFSIVGEACFALVKPFLNEKLQHLLQFHSGNNGKLYEAIPRDYLPTELGGTIGPLKDFQGAVLTALKTRSPWVKELCKKKVDESKRPEQAKYSGNIFGMEGSFKKLNID